MTFPRKRRNDHLVNRGLYALRRPLAPGSHQRKIEPQTHRLGTQPFGQRAIALQLRAVALDLAVEKFLEAAADVLTGLVVDDPAHPLIVDKTAVEDHSRHFALATAGALQITRQRVFTYVL